MNKLYSISITLSGDITSVENNIDMIISSIDFMGLDDAVITITDETEEVNDVH